MSELIYSVEKIFLATGSGCLQQYGCIAYRIPPYQRGYKWGSETNQPVERLISDLKQAWTNKAKEYLLQAITVKKVRDEHGEWVLEVIDGQQRLTTLFILIHAINRRLGNTEPTDTVRNRLCYSIRHKEQTLDDMIVNWMQEVEAPIKSFEAAKKDQAVDGEQQQDCYYLRCALLRCMFELSERAKQPGFASSEDVAKFRDYVLGEVKLMVNSVEAHVAGEVIFGNLNSNRVGLTEIELIKGLLLTKVAREPAATRTRGYREVLEMRIQLGRTWDEINHWANLPEIQSLYFPAFSDGMQGILELAALQLPTPFKPGNKPEEGEKPLFEYFLQQAHQGEVFRFLADTYHRLQDWYANDDDYHLLGYCLMHEKPLIARLPLLARQLRYQTKSEFRSRLFDLRRKALLGGLTLGSNSPDLPDLSTLRYDDDDDCYAQIVSIFLALSVFHSGQDGRFNFRAYQAEHWSVEHIFPQSPLGKGANLNEIQKQANRLINENYGVLTVETIAEITRLRDAEEEPDRDEQIEQIKNLIKGEPLLHRLGNLCLLTSPDNSSVGCGMFDSKRKKIRERIAQGSFVPRHTYEVFSKMIVGEDDTLDVWSKDDIEKHEVVIAERFRALVKEAP